MTKFVTVLQAFEGQPVSPFDPTGRAVMHHSEKRYTLDECTRETLSFVLIEACCLRCIKMAILDGNLSKLVKIGFAKRYKPVRFEVK